MVRTTQQKAAPAPAPVPADPEANLKAQFDAMAPLGSRRNPLPLGTLTEGRTAGDAVILAVEPDADDPTVLLIAVRIGWERRIVGRGQIGKKVPVAVHQLADGYDRDQKLRVYGMAPNGQIEGYTFSFNAQSDGSEPTAAERAGWSEKKAAKVASVREVG